MTHISELLLSPLILLFISIFKVYWCDSQHTWPEALPPSRGTFPVPSLGAVFALVHRMGTQLFEICLETEQTQVAFSASPTPMHTIFLNEY